MHVRDIIGQNHRTMAREQSKGGKLKVLLGVARLGCGGSVGF